MSDPVYQAYKKSVITTVRANFSQSVHRLPLWLVEELNKLYRYVPTQVPHSVLALRGVRWDKAFDDARLADRVQANLLLHNGWDLETSVLMYKNFRLARPTFLVDPNVWRTYSRAQLHAELGVTFGDVVADLISDPMSQPVFAALLFGELDRPIRRQYATHTVSFAVSEEHVFDGRLAPNTRLAVFGCNTKDIREHAQLWAERDASKLYHSLTGQHLIDPMIDPRNYDYDQAAIRAALRQADCAFDPFRQQPDEGPVPL